MLAAYLPRDMVSPDARGEQGPPGGLLVTTGACRFLLCHSSRSHGSASEMYTESDPWPLLATAPAQAEPKAEADGVGQPATSQVSFTFYS